MKTFILTFFALFCTCLLSAQGTQDTTIYNIADIMPYPLMRSCTPEQHPGWNNDSIRTCAESQLIRLLARNIRYPADAYTANIQGTVVVSCIVETGGRISNLKLLKDIGGGCGNEALRVLKALDEAGMRWQPGVLAGKTVRMRQTIPIKFKLEEARPFYVSTEGDTVYTQYDEAPNFRGGIDSLSSFIINKLDYPERWADSCKTGIIEMAVLIQKDGGIKVNNQLDFSNLGFDFQFEALRLARRSIGWWTPARYNEQAVSTTLPLRVVFKSDAPACAARNEAFDKSMILADEGAVLLEQEKAEAAIQKWTEALALQPDNCELLYYRGTAYMNLGQKDKACADYSRVKQILGVTWFEDIRRLLCGQ